MTGPAYDEQLERAEAVMADLVPDGETGAMKRLMYALGPEGRKEADVWTVCEALAKAKRERAQLVKLHTFMSRTENDSKGQSALAILEHVLGYRKPEPSDV